LRDGHKQKAQPGGPPLGGDLPGHVGGARQEVATWLEESPVESPLAPSPLPHAVAIARK
jgi:hypothetical protein